MTQEPAANNPEPQGEGELELLPESAPSQAPQSGEAQASEAQGDQAPEQTAAKAPPPPEPDRRSKIRTFQGQVKTLEGQIVEEKKAIGQELVGQDSIPTERQEMLPLLEQGATLKNAKAEKVAFRDSVQTNMDQLAATQAQKKNLDAQRGEQHKVIAARYVAVGRGGYQTYLASQAEHKNFAEFFSKIIALDKTITEKKAELEALEEQKKQGFFSKIKASAKGIMVKPPTEADRDVIFAKIGGQILGDESINEHLKSEEIAAILQELAEPLTKIREILAQITNLTEQEKGFMSTLNELKGESPTPKARLDLSNREISALDNQLSAVLLPLADAFLQPTPDTAGRTDVLEAALARLKEAAIKRTHAKTQIARLNAEIRVDAIVLEREGILQKRHKVAQELAGYDRRLADLHEEHVRHHSFITKVAQGASVELPDEEKKETLVSVSAAPLEADKVTNCRGRGRLNIGTPSGEVLYLELFGGSGFLFGRSHHDQKRGIRNDWVCRALPQDAPDASARTRRVSKVHGAFRGGTTPAWYMVDWSTAGITVDSAPVEKNGWIELPKEPCVLDIANGAVMTTVNSYPSESLLFRRPAEEARWYAIIYGCLGLQVKDGVLMGASPGDAQSPGFNIMFKDGHFGLSPRGSAPVNLNGQPLSQPQLLENNAVIEHVGYSMSFNSLGESEPAL
jgi:hypothetical protein